MTTTRTHDFVNRLTSIFSQASASSAGPMAFNYTLNILGAAHANASATVNGVADYRTGGISGRDCYDGVFEAE